MKTVLTFTNLVFGLGFGIVGTFLPAPAAADPQPVLMVIANQDFSYREYAETRAALEAQGLDVVIAAGTTAAAMPHGGDDRKVVYPNLALADVGAHDYSAIVFVGGWGASSYQYAFEGTYGNAAYRRDPMIAAAANRVIGDFVHANKPVAAICHGVSVLAWARVDGVSPLSGRVVAGWAGGGPGFRLGGRIHPDATVGTRWHVEVNGARMPLSAAIGDPHTSADDVWVDGKIITAENWHSAGRFARSLFLAIGR